MTCPKCLTHNAEPIVNWTMCCRKTTIPQFLMWECRNRDCLYQWPRDVSSLMQEVA